MQVIIDVAIAEQCGVKFYQTPAFAVITLQDVNKLAIVEIKNVKTGQMRYEKENPAKFRERDPYLAQADDDSDEDPSKHGDAQSSGLNAEDKEPVPPGTLLEPKIEGDDEPEAILSHGVAELPGFGNSESGEYEFRKDPETGELYNWEQMKLRDPWAASHDKFALFEKWKSFELEAGSAIEEEMPPPRDVDEEKEDEPEYLPGAGTILKQEPVEESQPGVIQSQSSSSNAVAPKAPAPIATSSRIVFDAATYHVKIPSGRTLASMIAAVSSEVNRRGKNVSDSTDPNSNIWKRVLDLRYMDHREITRQIVEHRAKEYYFAFHPDKIGDYAESNIVISLSLIHI